MNFYLRKNGVATGPMTQADFLARIASGEYSVTDEMSTDGSVWTRLGLTGYASAIRTARHVSQPRIGAVVGDLTAPAPQSAAPAPGAEAHKTPQTPAFPPVAATPAKSSPVKKAVPVLFVLLLAALGALAWFLLKPREAGTIVSTLNLNAATSPAAGGVIAMNAKPILNPALEKWAKNPGDGTSVVIPEMRDMSYLSELQKKADLAKAAGRVTAAVAAKNAASGAGAVADRAFGPLPAEFAKEAMEKASATKAATAGGRSRDMSRMLRAMEEARPSKKAVSMGDPYVKKAIESYVAPSADSQELLLINIERSEHVRGKFAAVADNTRFEYLPAGDIVNADSSIGCDGDGKEFGRIRLYGGLVRTARIMGAVLCFGEPARSGDEKVLLSFLRDIGATLREAGNKCSPAAVTAIFERHGVDPEGFTSLPKRRMAERIANGIVESVLAHEFGHLAKGHLNGSDANHQISQLEEKEADLFASQIAASVPEGAEVFAGQVLSMLVFSFIDDGTGGERLRSHPVARERVIDAIRSNPEYAAEAGLTEDGVREFYKAIDEKSKSQVP